MAYDRRNTVSVSGRKTKAKVIEFPRHPNAKERVVYCPKCKQQFPGGYNFNFCPNCGRALTLLPQ